MKLTRKIIIGVLITAPSLICEALGQAVPIDQLVTNLKVAIRTAVTDTEIRPESNVQLVLTLVGDAVLEKPDAAAIKAWKLRLDRVPSGDLTAQDLTTQISDVYSKVIKGHKMLGAPPDPKDVQELKQLEAEQAGLLPNFSTHYMAFLQALTQFRNAEGTNDEEEAKGKLDLARANLNLLGKRKDFIELERKIDQLRFKLSGGLPIDEWNAQFNSEANDNVFDVVMFPPYDRWMDKEGWTKLSFSNEDLRKTTNNTSTQTGGGGSGWFGMFKARVDSSKTVELSTDEVNGMSVEMEIKRVAFMRPWLHSLMFKVNSWAWADSKDTTVISEGVIDQGSAKFKGVMPLLPTGGILVRNVKLKSNFRSQTVTNIKNNLSASGGFSFGFFSVGGSHANSSATTDDKVAVSGSAIEIKYPQVIGYICEVLPRSPAIQTPLP